MTRFVFSAGSGTSTQLYASDGVAADTVNLDLSRFNFGVFGSPAGPNPDFTTFDGKIYFLASGGPSLPGLGGGYTQVYSTDGTLAGTDSELVVDASGGGPVTPRGLWVVNGKLLTSGGIESAPGALFSSTDGVNFTQILAGVGTDTLFVSGTVAYFAGDLNATGGGIAGLWRTDGTASGTYDIDPGLSPVSFATLGSGQTAFVNNDDTLWVTNGTRSGTHEILNAALGTRLDPSIPMVTVGGKAYFSATSAAGDYSVWGTDGTSAGTSQVFVDGNAFAMTRPILGVAPFGNKLVITTGYGGYIYDGSTSFNIPLPRAGDSNIPNSTAVAGGKLFLGAPSYNGLSYPLFVSDGTSAGTTLVNVPGLDNITGPLTTIGRDVVFEGTDLSGRPALFQSDGTTAGSSELALPAGLTVDQSTLIAALPDIAVAPPPPPPTVPGGSGVVTLGGGDQSYTAAAGVTVLAGSGNDTITANQGGVLVVASAGNLAFLNGNAPSTVSGGAGSATIFGGTGGGNYTGGSAGHDVLISQGAAGSNTTLTGAAAGDQLFGSAHGNDVLIAGVGRESVLGGSGPTTIEGGTAASVIFTGSGLTSVVGGSAGGDTIVGGSGPLTVTAQKGDAVFGNTGPLNVTGSTSGADSIVGGAGALDVSGQGGNMLVVASTSLSDINTGTGAALVFAGSGNSNIVGGTGSLQVVLGAGITNIAEGAGPSTYELVKDAAGGTDVIAGFKPKSDHIDLFGYGSRPLVATIAGNTTLSFADGTHIELLGVSSSLGNSIVG